MICREVIQILQQQSPEHLACQWDNVGLLIGDEMQEIKSIFIALDATEQVIDEAIACGVDMLLTHHPMIFKGLKKVNYEDFIGRRVIKLIKNDIAYYAMHTNFDVLGMADLAAEKMQLKACRVLQVTGTEEQDGTKQIGIGKYGSMKQPLSLKDCIVRTKQTFEVEKVKVFATSKDLENIMVQKVAICPGSGKSVIADALRAGVDVLVTGDIDHHEGIDAIAQGMQVIDAGHYGVEKIFIPYMKNYLQAQMMDVKIFTEEPQEPFVYV